MITIGAHFRGPELSGSVIEQTIREVAKGVVAARGDWKEGRAPAVNVVFYVPGSLGTFEIPKIEPSRFSRKKKMLLVAVPVPKDVTDAGYAVEFVLDALRKANAIAADVFSRKGSEAFALHQADAIVEKVRDRLAAQSN